MLLIDQRMTAAKLGVSVRTLEEWRKQGRGPAFVKLNNFRIMYRPEDIDAYVLECRVKTGGANG